MITRASCHTQINRFHCDIICKFSLSGGQVSTTYVCTYMGAKFSLCGRQASTLRAPSEHSEGAKRALRGRQASTQRAPSEHSEGAKRALRGRQASTLEGAKRAL